jgi:hypothetical protein
MKNSGLETLKAKLARQPFRPFVIEFQSGSTIIIGADTEVLFPKKRPELVIAFTAEGLQHEFEVGAIVRLSEAT